MNRSTIEELAPLFAGDDPAIREEAQTITTPVGPLNMYLARPSDTDGPAPGVLLIHDRLGLLPHFSDVARRFAKVGYIVAAPDLLSVAGGALSFATEAENIEALRAIPTDTKLTQLGVALDHVSALPECDSNRIGCVGFCNGGTMTWLLAVNDQRLKAAVVFYGGIPPVELVPNITSPVLALYGSLDEKINARIPIIESAMANGGKSFETEMYEGAHHAFFHDGRPEQYNANAAERSWLRTTTFLRDHLCG